MDDGSSPLWALTVFTLFIIVNGIMYGFGAAIQKVSESEIEKRALEQKDKKSLWLLDVIQHPGAIVNTISTTAIFLSILAGYVGVRSITPYVYFWMRQLNEMVGIQIPQSIYWVGAFLLVYLVSLIILIALGVLSAKKLFNHDPDRWVYKTAGIVKAFVAIFWPVTFLSTKLSNLVVRLFGVDPNQQEDDVTEEEIISMVDDAHEQGVIEESEAEMIQNIMEFSETEARDIMTHRKNLHALNETILLKDALSYMLENSNSRYPVYREDIDNIIGILHLKDVMKQITFGNCEDCPIGIIPHLIREAIYVPETRNINDLFQRMQAKKIHMVIVVDEYGQTSGIVTMEDILEEIVGNILDEYDEEEHYIQVQTDDSLIMEGLTPLEQVDEVLNSDFDEEDFDTLNGYLTSVLGHVPNLSEDKEIKAKGYLFTILGVENNTIQKVRVEKLPQEEKGEETCQDIQNLQI